MDGLSIAASITGIITAATQIGLWLSQIRDAPASVAAVASEIQHTKVVFRALQIFIDRNRSGARQNAWIVQVDDITVILTQTVLVLSQIQLLFAPWSSHGQQLSINIMDRIRWIGQEKGVGRLIDQLQRHKTSLSLLFQLIRIDSEVQALQQASALQQHIESLLETDNALAARLSRLQSPIDSIKLNDHEVPAEEIEVVSTTNATALSTDDNPEQSKFEADPTMQRAFDYVLERSRVYSRVKHREVDAITLASTTRTRNWSVLSGYSLAQISIIAVINLPLDEPELKAFDKLVSADLSGLKPNGGYTRNLAYTSLWNTQTALPEHLSIFMSSSMAHY